MNNNFNLKSFLAEGKLLKEETEDPIISEISLKNLLDKIPNDKYFYIIKEKNIKNINDKTIPQIEAVVYSNIRDIIFEKEIKDKLKFDPSIGDSPTTGANLYYYDRGYTASTGKEGYHLLLDILHKKVTNIIEDYIKQNSSASQEPEEETWDWDITEFGDYNKETNSFYEYGDDSFADYMDTEFPGWLDNEDIADKGSEKYWIDIENAAKTKYGPDVKIYTNSGELIN